MTAAGDNPEQVGASIVGFCRFARSHGLSNGMQQTLTALEAANAVGVTDWHRFSLALRTALCSSPEDWERFDGLFDVFWTAEQSQPDSRNKQSPLPRVTNLESSASRLLIHADGGNASPTKREAKLVAGASSHKRLRKIDFSEAPHADLAALEQLSLRLLRRMSTRLSRRTKIEARSDHVDLRRSIRRSIAQGGDPIKLAWKGRRREKKRLVIFLDISGSMNLYSLFLLRFAYALEKHFQRVHTFLFSTGVVEVSDLLRTRKLSEVLSELSQKAPEWSGGTRIGGSLREFNQHSGRRVLTRSSFFIIFSDGWDTGEPQLLAQELQRTRARVRKLLWLNPLLGLKDYQPVTRGMRAALPYVDIFAPAHNLESLLALERFL